MNVSAKQIFTVACVFFVSTIAHAYPDYIAKGYTNCSSCHYSPTGGGFANSYGTAAQQAFLPDVVAAPGIARVRQKADVTGYDESGAPRLQFGFGGDSRVMVTTAGGGAFFPMLLEVGGALAYGKLLAYGAVGPKEPEGRGIGIKAFSREHWLQLRATDTFSVRAGRIVLPFGLKQPDHTAYTRSAMGFGYYGQTYATEADYIAERVSVSVAGFLGDPTETTSGLRERGAAGSVSFNVESRGAFGVSGYYGESNFLRRDLTGVFARVRLLGSSYLMLELDAQKRVIRDGGQSVPSYASFARLGWFVLESLDVYLEHGWRHEATSGGLTQNRYLAGASWWLLPWVELAPQVRVESFPDTGNYAAAFLQLHVYY